MSKIKRLQVPVSDKEEKLFRAAAKIYKISTAEWARRIMSKAAERDLSTSVVMDPLDAVREISNINAPVGDVETMKKQSIDGRLR